MASAEPSREPSQPDRSMRRHAQVFMHNVPVKHNIAVDMLYVLRSNAPHHVHERYSLKPIHVAAIVPIRGIHLKHIKCTW